MEGTVSNSETLNEATPALTVTIKESETTESVVRDDAISSTTSDKYLDTPKNNTVSDSDAEADFLEAELNITNIASEKITENVEDIVQDLENLLGESSDYYGREANDVKLSQSHSEIDSIKVDKLENENETQLVSSQEVTSADASVTVTGDFKNVDTNEVVESTIPIQSKADEYDEGVIVDSTDTKTDELCEAQHELRSQDLNQCEASKSEIEGSKSECHLPMVDTPATECDDVSKHSEELIDNQQNISIGSETAEENADKTQYDEAIQCETTSEVTLEVLQETSQVDEVPPSDQLERGVETTSEEIVAQVNEAESISLSQSDQEKESGAPQVIVTEDVVTTGIVENEMKLSPEEAHTSAQINDCVPLNLCESGSVSEAVGVSNELNEIENVPIPFQNKVDVTPEVRPEPITELNQINEADSISLPLDLQNTVSKDELETNTMEGLETLQLPVIEKCAEVTTSQCEEIEFDKPESVEMQHGANQAEVLCDGEEMLKKSIHEMEFLNTDAVPPFINQVIDELSRSTNMDDAASIDLQKIEMHDLPVDVQYINQTENTPLDVDMSETLRPDYLCEDVSELDLACKSIQMVSEKMDIDLPQHDLCSSQFLDIPPDENMSEQSIAIASIMNEMGEGESEVSSMLNLEDSSSVPFPNLTDNEPLPEFICHDKLELENTQSTEDVMALSSEVNVELSQPLTVEVGESSLPATEQTQEMEEPSQSDRASLKMTITKTDNVHSILKIYDPDESNLEVVDPIPKLTETSSNPDEVPTTTSELLQTEVSPNAKIGNKTPEYKMEDHSIGSTVNSDTISTNLGKGNNLEANEKSAVDSRILEEHIQHHIEEKNVDVKPNPHENIGFMQKQEATHSPRITIKPLVKPVDTLQGISSPKHVILKPEEAEKESLKITLKSLLKSSSEAHYVPDKYSPKITIKPVIKPIEQPPFEIEKPTKVTIKPVLKVAESDYHPEDRHGRKISIKPIRKPTEPEEFQNTRLTMKTIPHLPEENEEQRPSPKITIKPIMKPLEEIVDHYSTRVKTKFSNELESYTEERHSPKITIKPIPKPNDEYHIQHDEKHNTKLIIKPILRTDFENLPEDRHSPKITIKPLKPPDDMQISVEDVHGAKVTIKPIPKDDMDEKSAPRITIKPILKPEEYPETSNPRITIKPIMKPQEHFERFDDAGTPFKLNIKPVMRPVECSLSPKITIKPVPKVEPFDPMELIDFEEQIKQERIVLKIPKNRKVENERVKKIKVKLSKDHGVAQILPMKRPSSEGIECETKHIKMEAPSDLSISVISNAQAISEIKHEDVNIKKVAVAQDDDIVDPLSEIPVFEITLESASAMSAVQKPTLPLPISVPPTPRKRGRPRKVPLEVREEFKDTKEEVVLLEVNESSRPKRSCRGPSVRATLGIRPRKPRGRGRGRPPGSRSAKKERKPYVRKNLIKDSMIPDFKDFDVKHGEFKHVPLPIESGNRDVVIYEEETRMSADNSSRAQTPAKQVLTSNSEVVEESQSSVQSNTTTESGEKLQKVRKGPRLEVHQEPEGEVISADKLAEYSWGGGGPYMLQEQVAQFLGIKSFKRKYPGIHRRPVDMQERDFIRESCLASEAMCDMGLTAVKREDILDIMYTDFQNKYEEYCKHQRDRQAKDVSNKQKALSLAASQEKNKLDIVEQAVQSAFQWNANFNKARREQRRACLDLQTFTVHFPKGKMKQISKPPLGLYPLALVPGQYTDYYKKYNPLELSRLPLNTLARKAISVYQDTEDSQSDGSGSDSDSSSSDSDSSYSGSSIEDCKMCAPIPPSVKKLLVH